VTRIQRPCARPSCPALVDSGYCADHRQKTAAFERRHDRERGSSAARGYGWAWRKFRAEFLALPQHQFCADGCDRRATEVHHQKKVRDFPELSRVAGNLRALCYACHAARTKRGE